MSLEQNREDSKITLEDLKKQEEQTIKAITSSPTDPALYYQLGNLYNKQSEIETENIEIYNKAIAQYKKGLSFQLHPNNYILPHLYNNLGVILQDKAALEDEMDTRIATLRESISVLSKATQIDPFSPQFQKNLYFAYAKLGTALNAKGLLEENYEVQFTLFHEALEIFHKARKLDPNQLLNNNLATTYYNLSHIQCTTFAESWQDHLSQHPLLNEIIDNATKALEYASENFCYKDDLHTTLGLALNRKGCKEQDRDLKIQLFKGASETYNKTLPHDYKEQNLSIMNRNLALVLKEKGQEEKEPNIKIQLFKEATEAYNKTLPQDDREENLATTYLAIGVTLYDKVGAEKNIQIKIEILREVIEFSTKAAELQPQNTLYAKNLAQLHNILGVALHNDAVSKRPDLHTSKILCLNAIEHYKKAIEYEGTLKLFYDNLYKCLNFLSENNSLSSEDKIRYLSEGIELYKAALLKGLSVEGEVENAQRQSNYTLLSIEAINLYNHRAIWENETYQIRQTAFLDKLEQSQLLDKHPAPFNMENYKPSTASINLAEYVFTSPYPGEEFGNIIIKLHNLFHNNISKCLFYLQDIDRYIRENQTQDFGIVPEGNSIRVGNILYTLPPENYTPYHKKGRLLQKAMNEELAKYGIDILTKQTTYCGFVAQHIANKHVSSGKLFAENTSYDNSFSHGKYVHMIQIYIIAKMLGDADSEVFISDSDLRYSFLKDLLGALVYTENINGYGTLWIGLFDESDITLKANALYPTLSVSSVKRLTSLLLFPHTESDIPLRYLSGYMRTQFWHELETIKAAYKHANHFEIAYETILAANAAAGNNFGLLNNITSEIEDYYLFKGYKVYTDSTRKECYYNPDKGVQLYIRDNIVTKYYEQDGHDLTLGYTPPSLWEQSLYDCACW